MRRVSAAVGISTMPAPIAIASGHAMRHSSEALGWRSIAIASVSSAAPSTPPTAAAATNVHSSRTRTSRNGPRAYQRSSTADARAAAVTATA